ncbi:aminotransferase [Coprinopsis sp. MPI-PUGE-AT-0042]|nr:aminotransferase [Coprinopsis sp. MPI-PUGE-AT-0042]
MDGDFVPHDALFKWYWLNGEIVHKDEAAIGPTTHSLHYASAVIEGIRAYRDATGKLNVFLARQHTERLLEGCKDFRHVLPYTADQIDQAYYDVLEKNAFKEDKVYIRPIAWRDSKDTRPVGTMCCTNFAIIAFPLPDVVTPQVTSLIPREIKRAPPNCLPTRTKSAPMFYAGKQAVEEAADNGFDDAIILDLQNHIADGPASNVYFLMADGKIHTPKDTNIMKGITGMVFEKLFEKRGIDLVVRDIAVQEVKDAVGIFICGTAVEGSQVIRVGIYDDYTPKSANHHIDTFDIPSNNTVRTLIADYLDTVHKPSEEVDIILGIKGGRGLNWRGKA